jgi:hypothetical protein
MALTNDLEKELLGAAGGGLPESLNVLRGSVDQLVGAQNLALGQLRDNTLALLENTSSNYSGGGGLASTAKSVTTGLGAGLFLSPLITGLRKLFGGGGPAQPPELVRYSKPAAAAYELPLTYPEQVMQTSTTNAGRSSGLMSNPPAAVAAQSASNITIQVQALDSRSIIDRSDDIARALKRAIHHSHSVNGAIAEV